MARGAFTVTCIVFVAFCCFLNTHGQQASLMVPSGPVSEAAGQVYVCVNITDADSIPAGGSEIVVFVSPMAGINPATPGVDYLLDQQNLTFTPGTASNCTSFTLIQDDLVEGNVPESILVRISNMDGLIEIGINADLGTISIEDDDRLELGFTQRYYAVQEDFNSFELCVRIQSGRISPDLQLIILEIILIGGTAQQTDDYTINFADTYRFSNTTPNIDCIQVSIVNDLLIEANETVMLQLRDTNANPITFTNQEALILIEDNDFATVTIDPEQLTVVEGNDTQNSTLELCAVLSDIRDGVQREITVNIATTEDTATAMNDFNLLSNTVTFQDNARENDRACFQVLIIGDNFIETDETFHVNLSTNFPDILGDPNSATVTVRHDGDGLCPTLTAPTNGFVVMTGNTVSSIAMYSCISNYALVGYEVRECTATAGWNRVEPICLRMCEGLNITNGIVNIDMDQPVEGAIATYTCNSGYRLSININRLCQREGIWSGVEPTCEEINCPILERPNNGRVTLTGTVIGARAIYSCEDGFALEGSSEIACGNDGLWVDDPPVCSGAGRVKYIGGMMLTTMLFIWTISTYVLS